MPEMLQPMSLAHDPDQEDVWVDATPFRAHLAHLLAAGLTEQMIAQLAGVSLRSVEHLVHGRRGRPVRRIYAENGRRLLRLTSWEARALRFRPVPSRPSRRRLRALLDAGWSIEGLADHLELAISELEQLLTPGSYSCSQRAALRIAGAYERHEGWEPDQPADNYVAVA